LLGGPDVFVLGPLVATAEQDNHGVALLNEVNAIPWPLVDPQFADAFANRFHIAQVAEFETADAGGDPSNGIRIFERPEPIHKSVCLADLEHVYPNTQRGPELSNTIHN
jgi:hypothetical protein